jgi:hypothetical protein
VEPIKARPAEGAFTNRGDEEAPEKIGAAGFVRLCRSLNTQGYR